MLLLLHHLGHYWLLGAAAVQLEVDSLRVQRWRLGDRRCGLFLQCFRMMLVGLAGYLAWPAKLLDLDDESIAVAVVVGGASGQRIRQDGCSNPTKPTLADIRSGCSLG